MSRVVAYLVSRYPSPSHTFVRREVAALRARGLEVRTFSVRRSDRADCVAPLDREEYERTSAILPVSLAALVWAHAAALLSSPLRTGSVLRWALMHRSAGLHGLLLAGAHFAESIVLARQLRAAGATHLHNHFANAAATVGLLASRLLGIPWSLTLHGTADLDPPAGALLSAKLARADFVACASWFLRAQAMRLADPADWPKLFVVRCGIEPAALPSRGGGSDQAAPVVLCVGRLSPEKGQLGLLEAFEAVAQEWPRARLEFVGDGPDRAALEAAILRSSVRERCRLLGGATEPEALEHIARATVLVSASFLEGLPVVLMEAMALGVPVVAPRVAGIPELVEDERSGLLFTPSRWDELAAQLLRLAREPELRERLTLAAKAKVAAEFSVETAVLPLLERFAASS